MRLWLVTLPATIASVTILKMPDSLDTKLDTLPLDTAQTLVSLLFNK